ncbi:hypothetical protein C8R44DRAFT_795836 [Mycena epipterygia]|nr:hypothetical protein C8R44DRAFT_795836 [Mycena epipterygia]
MPPLFAASRASSVATYPRAPPTGGVAPRATPPPHCDAVLDPDLDRSRSARTLRAGRRTPSSAVPADAARAGTRSPQGKSGWVGATPLSMPRRWSRCAIRPAGSARGPPRLQCRARCR